jgi:hexulose-6-phosphate isomerase
MFGCGVDGKGLEDRFRVLRDAGFEGVELDSPSQTKVEDAMAAAQKTGLVVHGLVDSAHWTLPLSHPSAEIRNKGREALETALRDAKSFGATSVLLVPGVVNAKQPYDLAWQRSQEEIRKVLPLAAECRVKIGIENVWNSFLLSPLEARSYVDELRSEWVGWHLDIGNLVLHGWPEQWVRILGKRICKLHIKEYSRKKCDAEGRWKGFDVELGEGDCGWPAVMQALDETGYSTASPGNWATAEVKGGDATRLKAIAAKMDEILLM